MALNTQVRYSLRAMIAVAQGRAGRPVRAQDIAARERISPKYLERLMVRLARSGLTRAVRGPGGGYVLARPADKIAVGDIVAAAGGRLFEIPCLGPGCAVSCELASACRARPVWQGLRRLTERFLAATTLEAVCSGRGGKRIAPNRRLRS